MKTSIKSLLVCSVLVFLLAPLAFAKSGSGQISATATAASTAVQGSHLIIVNQGSNEVFINVGQDGAVTTAATSSFRLDTDEGIAIDAESGHNFNAVSTICSTSETATVVYIYWD